ncbi:ATP-binding sensor histidine kinase [Nostoc sp. FACHB-110]|uniref:trifunctional serine/threonine-protein kinase/ATP-binding protein/sensor histidine kinase n=1 Tax=Nostoc sp. FACHB-110 TaxID=2692834 RepID=UPI001682874E|nr:ATP-binding sensor histidine kinase [Nostoc sp. FACHB-110]MBD2440276.1 AAA family ATPase [Nostoc sp. FACHB-110]
MIYTLLKIPGYRISEQLYNGSRTLVYRAVREKDSTPVVIKLLKNPYPSFSELLLFRNQYTIGKNLNSPLIIHTYSLESFQNGYMLVMEDFGGISLKEWIIGKILPSLEEFLEIAIALCDILNLLYHERIIHKDIKPSNILINPETKEIKLIDFSIASLLPREIQTLVNPCILEGTLAYISPEQTGRMNRGIDYRTDFYSLGITFYELLTSKLPFSSTDVMELVHSHIAKIPLSIHEINPAIPLVISKIVSKLMAKNAENRYKSALGLKYDLEKCLNQLRETGQIEEFEIATRDVCDRFIIPDKLYGRDKEVQTLLEAFERVSQGTTEMMLVAGFSGIGKTAVVNEVHKPIVRQRGYFIKGKYDQFQRNIPFSAFVQAFRDLMGQLLTESDVQIQEWKNKILEAVGDNGQVIIEVIPELENIIGKQPVAVELSGTAAQNRFNLLFQRFTQIFTTPEHPLVIFLDDLQWADSASLKLMQLLMADTGYLFIIGAYRDNEVYPGHPLLLTLNDIQKTQATINTITLAPLTQVQVNKLVADTLKCPEDLAWNLSVLIYQKTQGNPFFASQFLKALHQDELIQFDFDLSCWQCDISQVKMQAVTDDIVAFMSLQLRKLPPSTQEVLQLAACIGNSFDLATLAIVSEQSEIEVASALWKALQEGLVLPIGDIYKFYVGQKITSNTLENHQQTVNYKFLHDRVQQAAHSLIAEDTKQITHLTIGRLLLKNTPSELREEKIFAIVNQLNIGIELLDTPTQRDELARLNLVAGKKAIYSTAYSAAVEYLGIGCKLLLPNCWTEQYDLALALYQELASAYLLNCEFRETETYVQIVLDHAKTVLDTVKVSELKIQALISQHKLKESVNIALDFLKLLGVEFPKNPTLVDVQQGYETMKSFLTANNLTVAGLLDLPINQNSNSHSAAARIITSTIPAIFCTNTNLLSLATFKQVELAIKHGNTEFTTVAYSLCGFMAFCAFNDFDLGFDFGQLSIDLLEKLDAKALKGRVFQAFYGHIKAWHSHLRDTINPLLEGYQSGLETGDLEFASYNATLHCYHSYFAGTELGEMEQMMATYYPIIEKTLKQIKSLNWHIVFYESILKLQGKTWQTKSFGGKIDPTDNPATISLEQDDYTLVQDDNTLLNAIYLNKLILSYLFGDYSTAIKWSVLTEQYIVGVVGMYMIPILYLYDSLARLAYFQQANQSEQAALLEKVAANQDKYRVWMQYAPMNYAHKFYLVQAEQQRVLGCFLDAIELYDKAIAGAKENGYLQEEALANELAAKFYWSWGKEKFAALYMQEAYYCYAHWGAKAKVADLEKRYPQLLAPILKQSRSVVSTNETIISLGTVTSTSSSSSSSSVSDTLDLKAILKASQAISGAIELDKLLFSLLSIIIENAGADKCVLMLLRDDRLIIKGSITQGTNPVVLQNLQVEDSQDIPHKLIYKVKNSQQTVVLLDATADTTLANDPYIIHQQPKSILCSPILHQGKLLGILYLENKLTKGAFTSDRIEILYLICAQAAISLENARLYESAQEYAQKLEQAFTDLQNAQLQIVQSEKMSALGNLVAGVAHEMNNPLGFIAATLKQAKPTIVELSEHIKLYQETFPDKSDKIQDHESEIDLDYSLEDLPKMMNAMVMACDRLKNISTSLRTFSRADRDYKVPFNLHEGIDSTILILKHRLKANEQRPAIAVITNYGDLPQIECFPGQLNQVFMNILANAIDALDESNHGKSFESIQAHPNQITITTSIAAQSVNISIADNGKGMSAEIQQKIFDHLFTTKAVGKGTGLGLAIAKQIVAEKHGGKITVNSVLGAGTEFIISLPI